MRPTTLLCALALIAGPGTLVRADVAFDVIAYTDQTAPGTSSTVFTNFEAFSANDSGQVAFSADLYGAGVISVNNQGIWTGPPGAVSLYARKQGPVPGLPASIYYGPFGALQINQGGQIVFNNTLAGGVATFTDDGIWAGPQGGIQQVARASTNAPGAGSAQFDTFGDAILNSSGTMAFSASLGAGASANNNAGIWMGKPGAIQLLARSNDTATDAGTARFESFRDPVLSDSGAAAFLATLAFATPTNDSGIWYGTPGQMQLLARRGQAAPGTGTGPWFDIIGNPVINNAGMVCFNSSLRGTGVTSLSSNGVFAGTPGNLLAVAIAGTQAPGLPSSNNFVSFGPAVLNDAGQFAVVANFIGPNVGPLNDQGLYAGTPGNLKLIAQTYDPAPGLQTGSLFKSFDKILMDASGRVAVFATLRGGVNPGFDAGIWATDSTGKLQLVVWENPNANDTLRLPDGTYLPFATNALTMLGNRRTDFSVFGPGRIPIQATFSQRTGAAPVTMGLFFASLGATGLTLSAQIVDGQLAIMFPGASGTVYQMQYTDTLTPANWQQLGTDLLGTNGPVTVTEPIPSGTAQRYYRLKTL